MASQLQHRNALCGQEMTLNLINGDWDQIMQGVKGLIPAQNGNGLEIRASGDGGGGGSKLFTAPGSPLMRSAPMEVATRMAKVSFIYYASTFIARNFLFQDYILTKFSYCSLEIFSMESKRKNAQKIRENVAVDKTKSAYVIYEWPLR